MNEKGDEDNPKNRKKASMFIPMLREVGLSSICHLIPAGWLE